MLIKCQVLVPNFFACINQYHIFLKMKFLCHPNTYAIQISPATFIYHPNVHKTTQGNKQTTIPEALLLSSRKRYPGIKHDVRSALIKSSFERKCSTNNALGDRNTWVIATAQVKFTFESWMIRGFVPSLEIFNINIKQHSRFCLLETDTLWILNMTKLTL